MSLLDAALEHAAMLEQWTLCSVEDVPDDQWADQPAGLPNHPAWVLGHLTYAMDNVVRELGGSVDRDESWYEPFRGGSEPTSNRSDYPARDELLGAFSHAAKNLRATLRDKGEAVMSTPTTHEKIRDFFPTIGRFATHVLLVELAFHTGQISAWRRAKQMGGVFVEANFARMAPQALVV